MPQGSSEGAYLIQDVWQGPRSLHFSELPGHESATGESHGEQDSQLGDTSILSPSTHIFAEWPLSWFAWHCLGFQTESPTSQEFPLALDQPEPLATLSPSLC